jgi:hypothetical protein
MLERHWSGKSIRRIALVAIIALGLATPAHATDYGSGAAGGPVGTPVLSTVPYTAVSDVMIVGDSITMRGYKDLAAALPGKRLAVNAWSGRNTKAAIDSLFTQMQGGYKLPPVLIMATGANDVFDPFVMPAQVKRLLAGVPEGTKVYWVDVQVARPKTALADQRNSEQVNRAIWQGCTGDCAVISWATFLASKPARLTWYLDVGGVHPNTAGAKAWAALIAGSMK